MSAPALRLQVLSPNIRFFISLLCSCVPAAFCYPVGAMGAIYMLEKISLGGNSPGPEGLIVSDAIAAVLTGGAVCLSVGFLAPWIVHHLRDNRKARRGMCLVQSGMD